MQAVELVVAALRGRVALSWYGVLGGSGVPSFCRAAMRRKSSTGARAEQLRRQRTNSVGSCGLGLGSCTDLCGSSSSAVSAQPPSLSPQESRTLAPWTTSGPPLCLEGTSALPPHDTATDRIEQYRRRSGVGMKGELHLTGLALDSLPQPLYGLRHLTNLKELYLAHNKLGAIPDDLAQLTSLEKLDLTSNLLVELPLAASQVSHSAATLSALPGQLTGSVQSVRADHRLCAQLAWDPALPCSTRHEPEEAPCTLCRHSSYYAIAGLQAVTQLSQLIALHLSRNRLKHLPEAVGSLKALQWLDLRRNAPPACSKCVAQPRNLESQPQEAKAVSCGSGPWQSTPW